MADGSSWSSSSDDRPPARRAGEDGAFAAVPAARDDRRIASRAVRFRGLLALAGLAALAAAAPSVPAQDLRPDPAKIETAEACGECHVSEYEVWRKTPHALGFKTLHRKENAAAIAERMGQRLIKRDSPCLQCHYTPEVTGEELRAVSGVSCESCHGAGRDWINVHNDYGGKGIDHRSETPEHRAQRIARSREAGMRRPSDLYEVVASCYGCHTVPNEELVNVGRHSIGSTGFEFVAWSQGEIRHNFLDSFLNGDGTENALRPPEDRRRMYVAGRAVALEYALRGLAEASSRGPYQKAMERRLRNATAELRAIAARAELPVIETILGVVRGIETRPGNGPALRAAAEKIGAETRKLLEGLDGSRLASLDPLVAGEVEAIDDGPVIAETGAPTAAGAPPGTIPAGATPAVAAGGGPASASPAGATTAAAGQRVAAIPAEGEIKTRIRAPSKFQTIDAGECQRCHGDQNAWWFDDPHYAAVEPFLNRAPENVRIARLYGLDPARMTSGRAVCMDCHGTIVSGRESREVLDGVSCQSCHGPAKDFLEPHQEGDKALGARRPGYVKALGLGMVELRDLETRAAVCTGCHYVTDRRLLSAGHPSGAGFDYVGGMAKIRHWDDPLAPQAELQAAFSKALSRRGAVPEVRLARLAGPAPGTTAANGAPGAGATLASDRYRPRVRSPRPSGQRPGAAPPAYDAPPFEAPTPVAVDLPPFPEIDADTPIADVLELLKARLELLYRKVYPQP